jgi:hypothetical protein
MESGTIIIGALPEKVSLEAFDLTPNNNTLNHTLAYSVDAVRQSAFAEAFFPTVVLNPEQNGQLIEVPVFQLIGDGYNHSTTGRTADFKRRNIIDAVIDFTILQNEATKLIPIYDSSSSENQTHFSTLIPSRTIVVDNESITTAPLKIGVKTDILGISQRQSLIARGISNETDAVDSGAVLANLYVILPNGSSTDDVVKFDVSQISGSAFMGATQGNVREMVINTEYTDLVVNNQTKQADGSNLNGVATVGTNKIKLAVTVTGRVNQQEGNLTVTASTVTLVEVRNAAGEKLATTDAAYTAIATYVANASVDSYDINAYRTNSNQRSRGKITDTVIKRFFYPNSILSPYTTNLPIGSDTQVEANSLSGLSFIVRTRSDNDAVTALLNRANQLKYLADNHYNVTDKYNTLGAAAEYVNPIFIDTDIDVVAQLNSVQSANKRQDISSLLIFTIKDTAARLFALSNLRAAMDVLGQGGINAKPRLVIGTDPVIASYLTQIGDNRLLGEDMDAVVVSHNDARLKGKILFSFSSGDNSGVASILDFGWYQYRPEIVTSIEISRNDTKVKELRVQPSYNHVASLPVMGVINVTNLDTAIGGKTSVDFHTV